MLVMQECMHDYHLPYPVHPPWHLSLGITDLEIDVIRILA